MTREQRIASALESTIVAGFSAFYLAWEFRRIILTEMKRNKAFAESARKQGFVELLTSKNSEDLHNAGLTIIAANKFLQSISTQPTKQERTKP